MFTKLFWKDTLERLVATLAQVGLGLLSAEGVSHVHTEAVVATLVVAGLGVILKALAATRVTDAVSPASFVPAPPDGKPAVAEENLH